MNECEGHVILAKVMVVRQPKLIFWANPMLADIVFFSLLSIQPQDLYNEFQAAIKKISLSDPRNPR